MICESPQIQAPARRTKRQAPGSYRLGFQMDGVQSLQDMNGFNGSAIIEVVPDPVYEPFENGKSVFKPDTQLLLKVSPRVIGIQMQTKINQ